MIHDTNAENSITHANPKSNKCYPSNTMGQLIVNASTGEKYPYRVGSRDSLRLFKVTDTSGQYDVSGKKFTQKDVRRVVSRAPNIFYFDGPQEYIQHRGYQRDSAYSDRWREYQQQMLGKDDKIDISVYHNKKQRPQKGLHLQPI